MSIAGCTCDAMTVDASLKPYWSACTVPLKANAKVPILASMRRRRPVISSSAVCLSSYAVYLSDNCCRNHWRIVRHLTRLDRPSELLFHGRGLMVGCASRAYRPELVMMKLAGAAFHWP
jgi:hypothetical protein